MPSQQDESLSSIKENFAIIRELTENACFAANLRRQAFPAFLDDERIDWQNLSCNLVGYGFDELGREYYLVFIKKAHPLSSGLKHFIHQWLKIHGYEVIIELEW